MSDKYQRIRDALAMGPTQGPFAVNPEKAFVEEFGTGEPLPICAMLWPTEQRSEDETVANALLFASCDPDTIRELLAERDQLAAALEAARVDAERWRALREMDGGEIYALLGDCDGIHPEQADAAIDAAMEKENKA